MNGDLQILLQMYLATYVLYSSLLLTGALGALTVLQIRATTKRGYRVFLAAYIVFVGFVLLSVWRLLTLSGALAEVTRMLELDALNKSIIGGDLGYVLFDWIAQYGEYSLFFIGVGVLVLFWSMWRETEHFVTGESKYRSNPRSKKSVKRVQ